MFSFGVFLWPLLLILLKLIENRSTALALSAGVKCAAVHVQFFAALALVVFALGISLYLASSLVFGKLVGSAIKGVGVMSDSVADTITSLRNASSISKPFVEIPFSKHRVAVIDAMKRAGYIWDFGFAESSGFRCIRVALKYSQAGEPAFSSISLVSKPGNRVYCRCDQITTVVQGLGAYLISTNRGVLTDREARSAGVGGEIICKLF